MSICKRCGKDVVGIHTCTPPHDKSTPADPKAQVVEILKATSFTMTSSAGLKETVIDVDDFALVADRLDSVGLLASAPVVPSVDTLRCLLIKHSSFASVTRAGCEEIRNHLLTLGYKDNSDLFAAQAEVTRLRDVLKRIADLDHDSIANGIGQDIADEALAPKDPS